jgi:hypothetical protein
VIQPPQHPARMQFAAQLNEALADARRRLVKLTASRKTS